MENSLQKENHWVRNFAQILLVMNLIGAIAFYFAVPVYEAMQLRHHPEHQNHLWMTIELRDTLLFLNALAALLIIKSRFYWGIATLFVISTVVFVNGIQMQNSLVYSFLWSYWDVIGLLALKLMSHSARDRDVQTAKPSEADHG